MESLLIKEIIEEKTFKLIAIKLTVKWIDKLLDCRRFESMELAIMATFKHQSWFFFFYAKNNQNWYSTLTRQTTNSQTYKPLQTILNIKNIKTVSENL